MRFRRPWLLLALFAAPACSPGKSAPPAANAAFVGSWANGVGGSSFHCSSSSGSSSLPVTHNIGVDADGADDRFKTSTAGCEVKFFVLDAPTAEIDDNETCLVTEINATITWDPADSYAALD